MLMCLHHWRMLSDDTQKEVYRVARAYQKVNPMGKDFNPVRLEYYSTVKKAILEVVNG